MRKVPIIKREKTRGAGIDGYFLAYPLNEGGFIENINRESSLENQGVSTGKDRYGSDGKAAVFNGASYLSSPLFDDLQDATYVLWVKSDKDQTATILSLGNNCFSGYSIRLDKSVLDILCGGVTGNVTHSAYRLPIGEWVQIALVKSSNNFSIYVNGELSSSGSSSHNSLNSPVYRGCRVGLQSGWHRGILYRKY
ncbi:MAG: LamG-like jellyroll fold domain-containing protein [Bacteroidota bacterium]